MNSYSVTYYLEDQEHTVIIQAENTGDVFAKLEELAPDAHDIKIVRVND